MKKILLGTTAIVALSTFTAEAYAADPIQIEISGQHYNYLALLNNDETATATGADRGLAIGHFSNNELNFGGNTTLDNGLNVSIDFAAATQSGGEATISSDAMGAFTIGDTDHASKDFAIHAPRSSSFRHDNFYSWGTASLTAAGASVGTDHVQTANSEGGANSIEGGDGFGVKYVSPNFGGAQVYLSYKPTGAEGDGRSATRNATHEQKSFGIAYSGEVSGAAINANVGRYDANGLNADTNGVDSFTVTHVGLTAAMAGLTVGGGWQKTNDDTLATADSNDGTLFELGVAYETGPYSMSAGYTTSANDGTSGVAGDNKDKSWTVAATYDLGAGVALNATYFNAKSDGEGTGTTAATASTTVSGLIAGIEVGF